VIEEAQKVKQRKRKSILGDGSDEKVGDRLGATITAVEKFVARKLLGGYKRGNRGGCEKLRSPLTLTRDPYDVQLRSKAGAAVKIPTHGWKRVKETG